jgi:hypothetical protein
VPFTSFPASPNQTVVMTGISETISGTNTGGGTGVVTINTNSTLDTANSTARLTFDANGNMSRIAVSSPSSSVSLAPVDCGTAPTCAASNANNLVVAINPAVAPPFFGGWHYQTYGVWLSQTGPSTFTAGAMSAGAVTPGNAVPTTGGAVFSGLATGFYVDTGGVSFATAAQMSANVTFSATAPSIAFTTFGTTTNALDGISGSGPNPSLDLTGTLTYTPGSSQFNGQVNSAGGLSGDANGRFYGPAAQEIGGVYSLRRLTGGLERMLGAFGGRQP